VRQRARNWRKKLPENEMISEEVAIETMYGKFTRTFARREFARFLRDGYMMRQKYHFSAAHLKGGVVAAMYMKIISTNEANNLNRWIETWRQL
jgi:hypothetical protein